MHMSVTQQQFQNDPQSQGQAVNVGRERAQGWGGGVICLWIFVRDGRDCLDPARGGSLDYTKKAQIMPQARKSVQSFREGEVSGVQPPPSKVLPGSIADAYCSCLCGPAETRREPEGSRTRALLSFFQAQCWARGRCLVKNCWVNM